MIYKNTTKESLNEIHHKVLLQYSTILYNLRNIKKMYKKFRKISQEKSAIKTQGYFCLKQFLE